mgnify:CR=1 FL=1
MDLVADLSLVLLAALFLPFRLSAQGTAVPDSSADPALVIRGIQLQRRDIFDPDERSWFARLANKLHAQTRPAVIRRELLFRVGQPYDSALVAESERNLRALGLFRHVKIDSVRTPTGLMLRVVTKDGWTTEADWRFRSTGGEAAIIDPVLDYEAKGARTGTASAQALLDLVRHAGAHQVPLERIRTLVDQLGIRKSDCRVDGRLALHVGV